MSLITADEYMNQVAAGQDPFEVSPEQKNGSVRAEAEIMGELAEQHPIGRPTLPRE